MAVGQELESNVLSEQSESKNNVSFFVYILRTSSNTLYIGQTNNLENRLKDHELDKNKGAKYIRYFTSFELVYRETYLSRSEAMRREFQLKKWTKAKKEALISGNINLLKKL